MSDAETVAYIALTISSRPGRPANENPIHRGAQVAVEALRHDRSNSVCLDWKIFDDFGDLERTRAQANQIVSDQNIVGVVGSMGSDETFTNAPIFSEAGILQISPCASHPELCQRDYDTFFRLVANEQLQGAALASMARNYINASNVSIMHADDIWGHTVSDIFSDEFEGLGGSVVARKTGTDKMDDFTLQIQAIVDAQPDLVFMAVHPKQGKIVSSGLRQAGLKAPFLGTDAMKTTFPLGGGTKNSDVFHTHSGADFRRLPEAAKFRKEYIARFPEDSAYSPEAYDAVNIISEAVRMTGGSDRASVLREVRKLKQFDGVSGTIVFDSKGERVDAPISFYQVEKTDVGREMKYLGRTSELLSR